MSMIEDNVCSDNEEIKDEDSKSAKPEEDDNKNSKNEELEESPTKELKLARDPIYSLSDFEKGQVIFKNDNPSELYKVVNLTERDNFNKIQVKAKSDENNIVNINIKNYHEFSTFKTVKIVLINYLNKIFELFLPFNMNITFESLKNQFIKMYNLENENLAVIFRDKRLNNKELPNFKLNKDFDFDKDFIIIVQSKCKMDLVNFESAVSESRFNTDGSHFRKSIVLFHSTVKVSSFFLAKGSYTNSDCKLHSLEVFEVNENPTKYLKTKTSKNKRKQSSNDECDNYSLEFLFNQKTEDNEKFNIIYSAKNIDCEYSIDDEKELPFYDWMKSTYFFYPLPNEITFSSDKIYLFKFEIYSNRKPRCCNMKSKNKRTFLSNKAILVSLFVEKKAKESLICGFEFRPVSIFEN